MTEKDITAIKVEHYLGEDGKQPYHPDDVVIVLSHETGPPSKIILAGEIVYPGMSVIPRI